MGVHHDFRRMVAIMYNSSEYKAPVTRVQFTSVSASVSAHWMLRCTSCKRECPLDAFRGRRRWSVRRRSAWRLMLPSRSSARGITQRCIPLVRVLHRHLASHVGVRRCPLPDLRPLPLGEHSFPKEPDDHQRQVPRPLVQAAHPRRNVPLAASTRGTWSTTTSPDLCGCTT